MALPIFQDSNRNLMMMQNQWASQINPVLVNPITNASILKSVALKTGANVVNHLLGQTLQGWIIVRQRAAATIFDTQDANSMADLTLQLTSSANVVVDIMVF